MAGKSAVAMDSEMPHEIAQMLVAFEAPRAISTADPGIDCVKPLAVGDAHDRRAMRLDRSADLMAGGERQLAALRYVEFLALSEIEMAVHQMQVAVA